MVNVGIAGLGFMGMIHYLAYQKVRGATVGAICELDRKRLAGDWRSIKGNFGPAGKRMNLEGISRYSKLDEMLADPGVDMIDICLPPSQHAAVAIDALKAGRHVLCEKPIALKPADGRRMVRTAEKHRKMLLIAHVLPFVPEYRFAYRAITGGKYGRLLGGHFNRVISDPLWLSDFFDPNGCGGPMVDLHIHDAHFIRLVFGMPKAVQSVGRIRGKVVEFFNTQFLFEDPSLTVTATCGVINQQARPFTHGYEIHLERATLVFDSWMRMPLTVLADKGKAIRPRLGSPDMVDAFPIELGEAVRSVRTQTPSALLDGQLARDALILGHKQTQSVITKKAVRV